MALPRVGEPDDHAEIPVSPWTGGAHITGGSIPVSGGSHLQRACDSAGRVDLYAVPATVAYSPWAQGKRWPAAIAQLPAQARTRRTFES